MPKLETAFLDTEVLPDRGTLVTPSSARWGTVLLLLAMLVLTGLALHTSQSWVAASNKALIHWGANAAITTLDQGGLWRLLGAKLQLGSILTAIAFVPFFWIAAGGFERRNGFTLLIVVFVLVSALCSVATLFVRGQDNISVGAGGPAIALGVAWFFQQRKLTGGWQHGFSIKLLFLLPYFTLITYSIFKGGVDHGSLICGFVGGCLLGWLLPGRSLLENQTASKKPAITLLALFAALITVGIIFVPRPTYYWSEAVALEKAARQYESRINALNDAFDKFTQEALNAQPIAQTAISRFDGEFIEQWRALENEWANSKFNPRIPGAVHIPPMKDYVASNRAFFEATVRGWATGEPDAFIEAANHKEKLNKARVQMSAK